MSGENKANVIVLRGHAYTPGQVTSKPYVLFCKVVKLKGGWSAINGATLYRLYSSMYIVVIEFKSIEGFSFLRMVARKMVSQDQLAELIDF